MGDFDPDIGEGLDPAGPNAEDLDRFGSEFTPCPNCGKDIYDQAEICQHCGHAVEHKSGAPPLWALVVLAIVVFVVLFFLTL